MLSSQRPLEGHIIRTLHINTRTHYKKSFWAEVHHFKLHIFLVFNNSHCLHSYLDTLLWTLCVNSTLQIYFDMKVTTFPAILLSFHRETKSCGVYKAGHQSEQITLLNWPACSKEHKTKQKTLKGPHWTE